MRVCRSGWLAYWQASQPGSSMAQNLMSVATSTVASAAIAMLPGAVAVSLDTAFIWPERPVDFTAGGQGVWYQVYKRQKP